MAPTESLVNLTREPAASVISTSNALISETTSDHRISDGVGLANILSSVRWCLDRNVPMIPNAAAPSAT